MIPLLLGQKTARHSAYELQALSEFTLTTLTPIAVLIPTHNRNDLLARTLQSVLACEPPGNRSVRVIVIENGGEYGAKTICEEAHGKIGRPEYRFVELGNKSAALNAILSELPDHLVVFLDDDVRADPRILIEYAAAASDHREGRFYGGGVLIDYEDPPPDWLLHYLPKSATGWHPKPEDYAPMGKMHFFGANWAAFSRDLLLVGGFDVQFGPGSRLGATGQETQMQSQLVQAGVRPVYIPGAIVWHYVPKSRCSPEWAVERARRMAVRSGYLSASSRKHRAALGIPAWLWKSTAMLALERAWLTLRRADPETRFKARFRMAEHLGSMIGNFRYHHQERADRR